MLLSYDYLNRMHNMMCRFYLLSRQTSYAGEFTWKGDVKEVHFSQDIWYIYETSLFYKGSARYSSRLLYSTRSLSIWYY
jgi:hypothetical protein